MYAAGLQQAHDAKDIQALCRAQNIWRIGHGVNQLRCRGGADYAVFKQADCVWRMRSFRNHKGNQRKPHAYEDDLFIVDFAGRGGEHEFGEGVIACFHHRSLCNSCAQSKSLPSVARPERAGAPVPTWSISITSSMPITWSVLLTS